MGHVRLNRAWRVAAYSTGAACWLLAASAFVWCLCRDSVWEAVGEGKVVGHSYSSLLWLGGATPDRAPTIEGWTATYSRFVWFDYHQVAAVKVNEQGVVTECGMFAGKPGGTHVRE